MLNFVNKCPLLTEYARAMQNLEKTSWLLNKESVANELCEKYQRKEEVQSFLERLRLGFIVTSPATKVLREWIEKFIDLGEVNRGRKYVILTDHMQLMRAIKKRLRLMKSNAEEYESTSERQNQQPVLCDPCPIDETVESLFYRPSFVGGGVPQLNVVTPETIPFQHQISPISTLQQQQQQSFSYEYENRETKYE